MRPTDLVKATVVCAAVAYLVYSYPLVSQILLIGLIALVWGTYLYHTVRRQA